MKYFENIPNDEIVTLNIPTGIPLVYELDNDFHVVKKYYLGDPETITAKMDSVANQGKVK